MMKIEIKMGYRNAHDYLKLYASRKTGNGKKLFKDIVNDFAYCIAMTERMEKILEAEELKKSALKGGE